MWSENPEVVDLYRRLAVPGTTEVLSAHLLAAINADIRRQLTGHFIATVSLRGDLLLLHPCGTFRDNPLFTRILPYACCADGNNDFECSPLRFKRATDLVQTAATRPVAA